MRKLAYIFGLILLMAACKPSTAIETLPPSNNPVFEISGEFDETPIRFVAGENGMTVETEIEERNGVRYFSAFMSNGQYGLKIGFFDDFLTNEFKSFNLEEGMEIPLASRFSEPLAVLRKSGMSNFDLIDYVDWYIDGGLAGRDKVSIFEPGVYEVCASVMFKTGKHRMLCNEMFLGFDSASDELIRSFSSPGTPNKVWLEEEVKDIARVEWRLNGDIISNEESCSVNINEPHGRVDASIYHVDGSVRTKGIMIDGESEGNYVEDFDIFLVDPHLRKWNQKAGVEVINGNQELSSYFDDNYKNRYTVEKIEPYGFDENGNEILKVTATISAKIRSNTSAESKFVEAKLVLPFVQK